MKTALICLAAGFGLAHVSSFVVASATHAATQTPSYIEAPTASAERAAPIVSAFSQYEVQTPTTVTLVASSDSSSTSGTAQALAAGGLDQVVATSSTLSPVSPDIASNVARGVSQMDEAMKTAPVAMARMSESVAKNGIIAALAYDDPAVKAQTTKLSAQLGDSLRNFAEAIGKDMQRSVRESGIQAQSVSAR